jgi:hypothetical protein
VEGQRRGGVGDAVLPQHVRRRQRRMAAQVHLGGRRPPSQPPGPVLGVHERGLRSTDLRRHLLGPRRVDRAVVEQHDPGRVAGERGRGERVDESERQHGTPRRCRVPSAGNRPPTIPASRGPRQVHRARRWIRAGGAGGGRSGVARRRRGVAPPPATPRPSGHLVAMGGPSDSVRRLRVPAAAGSLDTEGWRTPAHPCLRASIRRRPSAERIAIPTAGPRPEGTCDVRLQRRAPTRRRPAADVDAVVRMTAQMSPPGSGRRGGLVRRSDRARPPAAVDHRPERLRQPADARPPTSASRSSSTAASTTTSSCANSSRPSVATGSSPPPIPRC